LDINFNPELPYAPSEINTIRELYEDHNKFKSGTENWYQPSDKMSKRIKIMKFFSDLHLKQHNELVISDSFRTIMPLSMVKQIMSIQDHVNYTVNENQFNRLLVLQGMICHNFNNHYLRRDMRFRDYIDANNVEYNNPYARSRIRTYNTTKNEDG